MVATTQALITAPALPTLADAINTIPVGAKPSSTVVLVRPGEQGLETLLLRRNPELKHMPDTWVFPGGKVDQDDADTDPTETAANAAMRELYEEAGIRLQRSSLAVFSYWLTPEGLRRRFATWFFIAQAHEEAAVTVDGSEIVEARWVTPSTALQQYRAGQLNIPPPTYVSLLELGEEANADDLIANANAREVPVYRPVLQKSGDDLVFIYDGDAAHGGGDLDAEGPRHRMLSRAGVLEYQRSFDWPLCSA